VDLVDRKVCIAGRATPLWARIYKLIFQVFHAYVQRAAHAGMSVGLSADATITAMSYTEGERQCLHALWAAIMQLYQELSGQQYSTQILAII
jgi:hypothetical protein